MIADRYPAALAAEHRLADGRTVVIRPIRPDDEAGERGFLDHLSAEARRRRFPKLAQSIDEKLVHFFTHIDYDRHMAFVCEADSGAGRELVGEARYVADPDGLACEFGVVVADEWHHTGVAQLLMDALIEAARAHGLRTMEGLVLGDNRDMLSFAKTLGFDATVAPEDPAIVRVVRRL